MFSQEYREPPDMEKQNKTEQEYDDSICEKYETVVEKLDNFIYLVDYYQMIEDSYNSYKECLNQNSIEFWKINKKQLDYLNAVYCYKEFISKKESSIEKEADKYYVNMHAYRFILDFRNLAVHHAVFAKEYSHKKKEAFVLMERLLNIQEENLNYQKNKLEEAKRKKWRTIISLEKKVSNAERFFKEIQQKSYESGFFYEGNTLCSMNTIMRDAQVEICDIHENMLQIAYEQWVKESIIWLISLIYHDEKGLKFTYIYNDQYETKVGVQSVFYAPTSSIDGFLEYVISGLGKQHPICIQLKNLLRENGYTYLFEQNCTIENFFA